MAKPDKPKAGCFSGFLQVLLCAGNGTSPPVHPSDHVTESDETELMHVHQNKKDAMVHDHAAATPGVVARLMGLDSLPKTNFLTKGATTPDSVPRSRSVNFVDYLLEFDPNQANNNHRRVKTSASFREVPALVQKKKGDLVVQLYWDDNDESKDHEALKRKETGVGESKQKQKQGSKNKEVLRERVSVKKEWNQGKNKKISKLKNEPRRVPSCKRSRMVRNHHCEAKDFFTVSSSSESFSYRYSGAGSTSSSNSNSPLQSKKKKGFVEPKFMDNKRNQKSPKKIETRYNLENLTPLSVPDTNDYPILSGTDFIDSSHSISPLVSKSKWESSSLLSLGDGVEDRTSNNNNKDFAYTDINSDAEYYSELILKLHTLTEKDIRESDITSKGIYDNQGFEEICFLFEQKILDLLLHEFVNEVVKLSC